MPSPALPGQGASAAPRPYPPPLDSAQTPYNLGQTIARIPWPASHSSSRPMQPIINIAAYRFLPLSDLKSLRDRLQSQCLDWELKGTILLSPEGINLFVAGVPDKIERLLALLRSLPGLE